MKKCMNMKKFRLSNVKAFKLLGRYPVPVVAGGTCVVIGGAAVVLKVSQPLIMSDTRELCTHKSVLDGWLLRGVSFVVPPLLIMQFKVGFGLVLYARAFVATTIGAILHTTFRLNVTFWVVSLTTNV